MGREFWRHSNKPERFLNFSSELSSVGRSKTLEVFPLSPVIVEIQLSAF